ncbi:hypothetical protein G6F70_008773 [Rhizopus microsporus]|uniref:Actin cytoskeleton-regulatory complex protein SLA1 n=2 Tax=Rhizopus TaxID=4842 RepID=A0A367JM31_RHIAZ|nr:hypothetical protein G6F71_008732 [Rhizopus microsporus]KAG1194737.1 hypothetical protein G6F70_008773 [Rhizopus microsporus]KAG1206555.1 hypothetical protein G6F69_008745 [Rhizopus microsporus]KAG1231573.1 hypothetical protein G6F67_005658 [Rhizopus microsporus]RCH90993.1 cytoskeletal protein binding protein [Rhizopus azygosporus]
MKYVQVSKALYDYDARTEDELSIRENDILYVIEKEDDDWWKAELKQTSGEEAGPVGLVTPIGRIRAEYDYEAQQEEELSFQEGDEMDLLEQDDPDWYLVKHTNGLVGLAPSNYVQFIQQEEREEEQHYSQEKTIPVPPPLPPLNNAITPGSIPPPAVQPILTHSTGTRDLINDDAQSWTVHEYDPAKKKKKKSKGNLFIGNGMLCYGSETDKTSPVQQYPILDVKKYLFDNKNLHIEIEGDRHAILDFQASSKSEAKAILVKISDSIRTAQMSATQISPSLVHQEHSQVASPAVAIPPPMAAPEQDSHEEPEEPKCTPKWGLAVYEFHAQDGDELSIEENEQLYVLDYLTDDGWWRVQKVNGDVGLVPSSYVQLDQDDNQPAEPAVPSTTRVDNVDEIRRQREQEERELRQRRIAEEEERKNRRREEEERRQREEEARRRREEEERRRREEEEERRREEAERERRRQAQEAAKRAEAARQKQIEEEYRRKEAERKATLSRAASTSSKSSTRQQDLPKPDLSKVRTWTDRTGSFKVEAQLIDVHNGKLRLHKLNGVKIDVPVEKMSVTDLEWVSRHHSKSEPTEEPTPAMPPRPVQPAKKINESWDWFDWFMTIGIPMQASLQYASAFKADKLDDSDIPKLTHKQMKTLGMKEEHVRRVERYIETGQPEEPEEAMAQKVDQQSQIEKDAELARKLQREFDEANKNNKNQSAGRPRPSVSAPKDVHPDLLGLIGNQLSTSDKGKESEKPKNDLLGFSDDAWTPRPESSSPMVPLTPVKATPPQAQSISPPAPAPAPVSVPTGPTPEELRAQEEERRRIAEQEQIQKIKLMNLQRQAEEQQKQLEELQRLTKQQLELQKQLAMHTGTQQQQQQMQQLQLQQQQLQAQLAQQPAQLQPSLAPVQQPQQMTAGRPRPVPNHRLSTGPSLSQWNQPNSFQSSPQQQMQTGFSSFNNQQQMQTGYSTTTTTTPAWQAQQLQPQMTGFPTSAPSVGGYQQTQPISVPLNSVLHQPLMPTAAGQQANLQRSNTIGVQPTGRHWNNATPENPFGSPTLVPLQAQMTGAQFSTPSPTVFNQSPIQSQQPTGYMQPQMTGIQPQPTGAAHSIFTPQGSMQYGQSAFPNERRW